MPFLSDDWINLSAADSGSYARTSFGYFRPLYIASYWLDWTLFGLSPVAFHITDLLLAAACAWLVVIALHRLTGDASLAGVAGVLFALHPYHIDTVAWIAARAELLYSGFFLLALLAWLRWRAARRGVPITALLLFVAALLCKEAAVTFPALVTFLTALEARKRSIRDEVLKGLVPLWLVALVHFAILRPLALGDAGMLQLSNFGMRWIWKLLGFATAVILPAQTEVLEIRPLAWAAAAIAAVVVLLAIARLRAARIPPLVWACGAACVILIGPSLVGFQERFFYLPSAAAALAWASFLAALRRRWAAGVLAGVVAVWLVMGVVSWSWWLEAGRAGRHLMADLVEASRRQEVQTIVLANAPHRVAGPPVVADWSAAARLAGGRPVRVISAAELDYPTATEDFLDRSMARPITYPPPVAEVRLRVPRGLHARLNPRRLTHAGQADAQEGLAVREEPDGRVVITIEPDPARTRAAYVWTGGRLRQLF